MGFNEADTRAKLIDPKLYKRGWTEEYISRDKRVLMLKIVTTKGKTRKQRFGRVDYALQQDVGINEQPIFIAFIEAKREDLSPNCGLEQVKEYAKLRRDVQFVYSTNGHEFVEYNRFTKITSKPLPLEQFPTPDDLESRYIDPYCGSSTFLGLCYEYMQATGDEITSESIYSWKKNDYLAPKTLLYGLSKKDYLPLLDASMTSDQPKILNCNTLTQSTSKKFDIILTNPPFYGEQPKKVQDRFIYKTSATSILFLQHAIDSLKQGGKCSILLSEEVLSCEDEAAVQTKRKLLNDCNVRCIVSLPSGIFAATGVDVKANILFFTRGKATQQILYYDLSDITVTKHKSFTHKNFKDTLALLSGQENSERSWTVTRGEIEARNYNLQAVNPNI